MNIFADNNVFCGFLGADSDIEALKKLLELMEQNKVTLLVTDQLLNEYLRNAGDRMQQERDKIESWHDAISKIMNESGKHQEKEEKIRQAEKQTKEKSKALDKHLKETDKLISKILSQGKRLKVTEEIIKRAQVRKLKGNPPGKKNDNSCGDAIHWESLLEYVAKSDLNLVTFDGDFTEQKKEHKKLNRMLDNEWRKVDKKSVKVHASLGDFINTVQKSKPVKQDSINKEIKSALEAAEDNLLNQSKYFPYQAYVNRPVTSVFASNVEPFTAPRWRTATSALDVFNMQDKRIKFCPNCGNEIPGYVNTTDQFRCIYCGKSYNLSGLKSE